MSMEYIRRAYGVPARRGTRIVFDGNGVEQHGVITSAAGTYLRVHFDGEPRLRRSTLHPTWHVRYLENE
jgi:hypothetical protein